VAEARTRPRAMIVDLNITSLQPLDLITELKKDVQTTDIPVVGYVSHVQTELIRAAQSSGFDRVMARSAFSKELPALLRSFV